MKGLLIFPILRDIGKADGIVIKNEGITQGFRNNGADVDVVEYFADGVRLNGELIYPFSPNRFARMYQYHYQARKKIREFVRGRGYDFVWYRTPIMNRRIANFIEGLRNDHKGVQVILEYGYYPYINELKGLTKFKYQLNRGQEVRAHKLAAYMVTYAGQKEVDGVTVIPINNGIDLNRMPLADAQGDPQKRLDIISVSSFKRWHAVERLIAGLPAYLSRPGATPVHLQLVGFGPDYDMAIALAKELNVESSVTFHHFKGGAELDAIYAGSHVAIGTLGFHRIGITFSSSLKNREYFGRGLPVVLSTFDEDMPADLPYVLYVPEGEEPIDIAQIVTFTQKLYQKPGLNASIRKYAEETVTWDSKMRTVLEYLAR